MQPDPETLPRAVPEGERALADRAAAPELSYAYARHHGLIVADAPDAGARLGVALREGADPDVLFRLQRHFGRPLALRFVPADTFEALLGARYPTEGCVIDAAELLDAEAAAPEGPEIDRLVASILADAAHRQATDVHLEPARPGMVVRMRIAGVLSEALHLPPQAARALCRRLKALADLDPREEARPQHGRLMLGEPPLRNATIATLPSWDGERVVLRLGGEGDARSELRALGMASPAARAIETALARKNGLVLVASPPGSGRMTTLRAMLRHLNNGTRNILAVERRVKAPLPGVGQIETVHIADGLRAVLRQDPDVVMVSDLEDRETATLAAQAAASGHLVLAGIDCGDAVGAILQLRALRLEPFLLASTLRAVLAQRLVARLCPACRRPMQARGSVSALLGFDPGAIVYAPTGCESCGGSGLAGQTGVFETLVVDEGIRRLINDGGDEAILARHAFLNSPNLGSAARALVREGVTTPEEAVRVSRSAAPAVVR